jgi:hypothetical protein
MSEIRKWRSEMNRRDRIAGGNHQSFSHGPSYPDSDQALWKGGTTLFKNHKEMAGCE